MMKKVLCILAILTGLSLPLMSVESYSSSMGIRARKSNTSTSYPSPTVRVVDLYYDQNSDIYSGMEIPVSIYDLLMDSDKRLDLFKIVYTSSLVSLGGYYFYWNNNVTIKIDAVSFVAEKTDTQDRARIDLDYTVQTPTNSAPDYVTTSVKDGSRTSASSFAPSVTIKQEKYGIGKDDQFYVEIPIGIRASSSNYYGDKAEKNIESLFSTAGGRDMRMTVSVTVECNA